MRGTVGPLWLAWLVAASAAGGCSMFDQVGGGGLSFDLPRATFSIATSDSRWWPAPPNGVPDVICSGPLALVSDCCQPPANMDAVDCQEHPPSCDDDGKCALAFDYDDAKEIDLRSIPALQDQRGWVLAQATVDPLTITVPRDDGGVVPLPLRDVSLYVAPLGVDSAHAAGATFLADNIAWRSGGYVDLTVEAQIALSSFLVDFNTPFNLILSAHVVQESGPAPTGAVTMDVSGRVKASF